MGDPIKLNGNSSAESDTELASASRRDFLRKALGAGAAIAVGQWVPADLEAQAAGPAFASPGEIGSSGGKLNAVLELNSEVQRMIPNVAASAQLRYFQGWNMATPNVKVPDLRTNPAAVTPGPTLRAKVGDQVQIAFFNKVDDSKFRNTFVTAEGRGAHGCDAPSNPGLYPAADQFPNCFHGSSAANLHFHGTHTSPNGLADNVLAQVMPNRNLKESDWEAIFKTVFAKCPQTWRDMPSAYRAIQRREVTRAGRGLWAANQHLINAGEWPQYFVGAFPNCFEIPDFKKGGYKMGQAPGTHWYHAHKHGSTALHILNGLAGAFIIEGDYDVFLRTFYNLGDKYPASFEKVLVVQNIGTQQNLELQNVSGRRNGSAQPLVNGMLAPTMTMRPNEVQLWRIVNATVGGNIQRSLFTTQGFTFRQTAQDGVQLSKSNYRNQPFLTVAVPGGLTLAAGNRADVLVQAPSSATPSPVPFVSGNNTLFYVSVTGAPVTDSKGFPSPEEWPDIPAFLQNLGNPQGYPHRVSFGWDAEPQRNTAAPGGRLTTEQAGLLNVPPRFTIDNRQFEELGPIINQCMPLNGLQDWVVENHTTIPHPFHIHINPFQVMQIDTPTAISGGVTYSTYTPSGDPVWQDVVTIPAGVSVNNVVSPGQVRIRHQFVDFTGTYVLHCHILGHEDRGMMQLVRVVDAGKYPNACQTAVPEHR